jgi:hypothetical protein
MYSEFNNIPDGDITALTNLTGREPTSVVPREEFERLAREANCVDDLGNIVQKTIFIVKPIVVPTVPKRKNRTKKQWEIYHQQLENPFAARTGG